MNDLIKITPDGRTTSRELYEFLELEPSQYSRWCKTNLLENEFAEEKTDWGSLDIDVEYSGRGQRAANYWLTISFAKKLCMMSKSERGEQARNYFIEAIIEQNGQKVVDSREVAEMVDKRHDHLMRDIDGYCEILTNPKLGALNFFIPANYVDAKGEARRCFLLTRMGCDMVANKLTGEKGVLFTAASLPTISGEPMNFTPTREAKGRSAEISANALIFEVVASIH